MPSATEHVRALLAAASETKGDTKWLAAHLALLNCAQDLLPAMCDVIDAADDASKGYASSKGPTDPWMERLGARLDALDRATEQGEGRWVNKPS